MCGGPSDVQATDVQGGTNDEVQTVALSNATDGVFRLAFGGQVTPPLAFDSTAGDVETALEDLATLDDETVTGGVGGPWTVTFGGAQAGLNVAALQGDTANLLGLEKGTGVFSRKRPPSPFRRITIYAIYNVSTK